MPFLYIFKKGNETIFATQLLYSQYYKAMTRQSQHVHSSTVIRMKLPLTLGFLNARRGSFCVNGDGRVTLAAPDYGTSGPIPSFILLVNGNKIYGFINGTRFEFDLS